MKYIFSLIFLLSFNSFSAEKPNIIFFLADDLGWTDLSGFGSSFYESPNLDNLSAEGLKFTQAYCAGSVCSPTRASIVTGQVPARNGCTQYGDSIRGTEICFAEVLSENGYETFFTGKWHIGGKTPEQAGFKTAVEYSTSSKDPEDPKSTRQITQSTLKFLEKQTANKAFMAYVNYHAVHLPHKEKESLVAKYKAKLKSSPPQAGLPKGLEMEGDRKNKQVQDDPYFAAMVEGIDTSVGKILKFIKEKGFEENTVVIFSSDNGGLSTKGCTSNLPLRAGKGWLYEGGVRVPTIIKWPSVVKAGSVSKVPINSTDYYPTMLSIAGIDLRPKDHVDGYDLVPLLKNGTAPSRQAFYWHYPHDHGAGNQPSGSILLGGYKLITYFRTKKVELYKIDEDLSELEDLSAKMPEKTTEMLKMLEAWQKMLPNFTYGSPVKTAPRPNDKTKKKK